MKNDKKGIDEKRLEIRNRAIAAVVIVFFAGIILFYYSMLYGEKKKTAEGIKKQLRVIYGSIKQWSNNFEDYLKSAMSYTNCYDLQSFTNKVNLVTMSANASFAFNR